MCNDNTKLGFGESLLFDFQKNKFSIKFDGNKIEGGRFNILVGKNGCGKSRLLRKLENYLNQSMLIKYITPERGGELKYESTTESNIAMNKGYLRARRGRNQASQYRQQSFSQLRNFEMILRRKLANKSNSNSLCSFDKYLLKINSLLDNVEIRYDDGGSYYNIFDKLSDTRIDSSQISSGESELISLAIECILFAEESHNKKSLLLIDEPDVHLHPDMQDRFISFLTELVKQESFFVIIATHSTAILGAVNYCYGDSSSVHFMSSKNESFNFLQIESKLEKIIPIFGAHPLSNIFNKSPILLVEGEDDERIWQQAIRTAEGKLLLHPCSVNGVSRLDDFEKQADEIISSLYERAEGYSLRDGDDSIEKENINDLPCIKRFRLNCYSAENLLLSEEVLTSLNTTWIDVQNGVRNWIENNPSHKNINEMKKFAEDFDRQKRSLKKIRNDLMGIIGSNKPWEVAVGCVIGRICKKELSIDYSEGKICQYLSKTLVAEIIND